MSKAIYTQEYKSQQALNLTDYSFYSPIVEEPQMWFMDLLQKFILDYSKYADKLNEGEKLQVLNLLQMNLQW